MNIDDASLQADHPVNVRHEATRRLYTSGAGGWIPQQGHLPSPPY